MKKLVSVLLAGLAVMGALGSGSVRAAAEEPPAPQALALGVDVAADNGDQFIFVPDEDGY